MIGGLPPADLIEPNAPDPDWPRYSSRAFPPYRFVPGRSPHPRNDPAGHMFDQPEPEIVALPPGRWREDSSYRYGIDLFNFAYWWECHEALEGLWNAVGRKTQQGLYYQGLIQVAAGHLKRFLGVLEPATTLASRGLSKLDGLPKIYMGVHVPRFRRDTIDYFEGRREVPVLIALAVE